MNLYQIVKVDDGVSPKYGICLSEQSGLLLLEDGTFCYPPVYPNQGEILCLRDRNIDTFGITLFYRYHLQDLTISNTRNVPEQIRKDMESAAKAFLSYKKEADKFMQLYNSVIAKKGIVDTQLKTLADTVKVAKGLLSEEEFLTVFKENLSDKLQTALENGESRGYDGLSGKWNIDLGHTGKMIRIYRELRIDKYIRHDKKNYPFVSERYDGTLEIAEEDQKYHDLLASYRKTIPFGDRIPEANITVDEELILGDKDSLWYREYYFIPIDKTPLTAEKAIRYAELVSDPKDLTEEEEQEETR